LITTLKEWLRPAKLVAKFHMAKTSKFKSDSKRKNWGKKRGPSRIQLSQYTKKTKTENGKNKNLKRVKTAKVKCFNCEKRITMLEIL
ncbi:hypothetical protein HAX54_019950, partial [Datura stramonium]|nr:hypothetical protein [Datura stramonium]